MSGRPPSESFWDDSTVVLIVGLLIGLMVLGGAIAAGLPDDPDPNAKPVAEVTTTATVPGTDTTTTQDTPPPTKFELTVTNAGDGRGEIRVDGETRDCSDACRFELEPETLVTLVATPSAGSSFAGWTEPCDVLRTCRVEMDGDQSVTALFDRTRPSTTECEDGIDNDVDELIDADDSDCLTGDSEDAPVVVPPPPPPVVQPLPPPPPPPARPPPPPAPVDEP